jgi:lysophospholipase L1-like esterase
VTDCWRRSGDSFSGQLAARAESTGREVEYTNRACIGATTADIISRDQRGTSQKKQIDYITDTKPDVITLTIGGNDIGFGPLARNCVINSVVFIWQCDVSADRVNLVNKQSGERDSYDGLYDRLVATYVAVRNAQGAGGHLYVLSYPTVFEKSALWDAQYLLAPRTGPLGLPTVGNCFGFASYQARESNKLSARLGDTIYLAVQAANAQVGSVHWVDWRNDVVTEGEGFLGLKKVRVSYNSEGLCARNAPWDMNGLAFGSGQQFGKDSFHPTRQGYAFASNRLETELGW